MISTNFAPNESWDDAWVSFKLLFQPWRWRDGKELSSVKKQILSQFKISSRFNRDQIALFLTGRSALYHLLKSLNLNPGDEVLVQAFTCEAVVLPIIALNLKPVYVDIEEATFSINPIDLEKKLTKQAKVLILQHTFGMTPRYRQKTLSLVRKHKLVLIEDIAHGTQISNFKFQISNSYSLMSFGRSKALSSVFGGAVITNNQQIAKKLRELNLKFPSYSFIVKSLLYKPIVMLVKSTYNIFMGKLIHKIAHKLGLIIPEITASEKKGVYDSTFNKAYPNALAILLLHQLNKYEQMQQRRASICDFYQNKLKNVTSYKLRVTRNSLLRYPLLVNNRDFILNKAAKNNVFLGKWYDQVVAPKGLPLNRVGYQSGSCPVAEKLCQKIINLPTNINVKEAETVIETLNDVIKNKGLATNQP